MPCIMKNPDYENTAYLDFIQNLNDMLVDFGINQLVASKKHRANVRIDIMMLYFWINDYENNSAK